MQRAPSRGDATAPSTRAAGRLLVPLTALVILAAAARALWLVRDLGLLGLDSYPLLLTAQTDGVAGLLRSFFRPLFGDWMPAPYYRPVLHASVVLDRALYGLAPFGHHASSVAIFALCGAAQAALARALGLGAAGTAVALALLLLHPVQAVVLPVPARRADSLCLLFTLLALAAQVRATRRGDRVPWRPALLAALALGAKETGFAAPPLCVLAAFAAARPDGATPRWRAAVRALGPQLAVLVLGAALRTAVLGDLLGGRPVRADPAAWIPMLGRVLAESLSARAVWPDASLPGTGLVLLVAGASFAAALAAPGRGPRSRSTRSTLLLALGAVALLSVGYALGVLLQPWYLLLPAAFVALALGAVVHGLAGAGRSPASLGGAAGAGLLGALLVAAPLVSASPLLRGFDAWERADRRAQRYLEQVASALERARPGERIALEAPPALVGGGMRGVVVLAPYTVAAWARLTHPELPLRVTPPGDDAGPTPGEIVLALGRDAPPPRDRRPSVVLILADDLGYADLGFQGSREIATPHLDRLAREGVRFTDAYVTSPLCAPTRAALLTGRDPNRYGYTAATGTYQDQVRRDVGLDPSETLLSQVLARAGYATSAVGKWHLGVRPPYRPLRRGFQHFFGFLAGTHDYYDWGPGLYGPVFRGNARAEGDTYLTEAFASEAAERIRAAGDDPFFVYTAFHAVHGPLEAPARYLERYGHLEPPERRAIAAMTASLDEGVGVILDALEETGRADDTLVLFWNDNGGIPPISHNEPLRGGKGDLLEGGIRVPSLLRWPARVEPGVFEAPVSVLDVFPTVAAATGADPGTAPLDGVDLVPHLLGRAEGPPHDALFWRYGAARAIRRGAWKWVEGEEGTALYDLERDPGEAHDRAADEPGRAASLRAELDAWTRTLGPAWPEWAPGKRNPEASEVSEGP